MEAINLLMTIFLRCSFLALSMLVAFRIWGIPMTSVTFWEYASGWFLIFLSFNSHYLIKFDVFNDDKKEVEANE